MKSEGNGEIGKGEDETGNRTEEEEENSNSGRGQDRESLASDQLLCNQSIVY